MLPRDNNFIVVRSEDLMASIEHCRVRHERSGAVKMRLEQDELKISSSSTDSGESEDTIETPYNFDAIVVGFNSAYLIDFLKAVGTAGEVRLEFKDAQSAGQVGPNTPMMNIATATSSWRWDLSGFKEYNAEKGPGIGSFFMGSSPAPTLSLAPATRRGYNRV